MRRYHPARRMFLVWGLGCLLPAAAHSTTFVLMDEPTLLRSSAAVIVGTITAIESGAAAPDAAISTYVHVQPERVIKGPLGLDPVVLREPGGTMADRYQVVEGAPAFWVGERALLFLSRNRDGTLQTNSLAMGKYDLYTDPRGRTTAVRNFDPGSLLLVPETGQIVAAPRQTQRFLPLLRRLRRQAHLERLANRPVRPLTPVPEELSNPGTRFQAAYTFMTNPPSRWFQPDRGQPVVYYVDSTGDPKLGSAASQAAIDAALAAWSNVATSNLVLQDGGLTSPAAFGPCDMNRIVFNDPFNEITNPSSCSGILAIGGYCGGGGTTVVNGTTFGQITVGKLTFNNGWSGCWFWNQCNVSEVATHEIGHTIGLGHSTDWTATMYAFAHFDGRCAGLKTDDMNAITFMYPRSGPIVPTSTPAAVRTSTPTATPTSAPPTATRTSVPPTSTPTPARSMTPTVAQKPTMTATLAPTRTPTMTPRPTFTRVPATPTSTPVAVPSVGSGPPNDACGGAIVVTASPFASTVSVVSATAQATDPKPSCNFAATARTIWYRYTAPRNGTITADTVGSTYDTVLSAYTGACGALTPVFGACNDNLGWFWRQSRITFAATAGRTYYFMISTSPYSIGGTATFHLTLN